MRPIRSLMPLLLLLLLSTGACGGGGDPGDSAAADSIAAGVPETEIYLADLTETDDTVRVGALTNVTRRPGYDNQPHFTANGALLYTAIPGDQADIYRYDPGSQVREQVTDTPQSEYSPTSRPDARISVVRVEDDGRQRLWQYSAFGKPIAPLLPDADSIGYHAWLDTSRVAAFVLGEPPTLRVYDVETGRDTLVTDRIGRSLQSVPERRAVSFVRVQPDSTTRLFLLTDRLQVRDLMPTPGGGTGQDHAWTPQGTLLMAAGDTLYAARPLDAPDAGWTAVRALDGRTISRLAAGTSRLALVGTE